jgi:MerR family transcriptional regulator, thiopeptide resistance regulator
MYTVKQLSDLAGITVRTLHHYDQIDLLQPTQVGDNGYRYYNDEALLRLQQILFYREIGLELAAIKDILDSPDFDTVAALRSHRRVLHEKVGRLHDLIRTVDDTIAHIAGEKPMSKRELFRAFTDEEQKDYEREARLQYGPDIVNQTIKRWNSYTKAQQQAVFDEANGVYSDIIDAIETGKAPTDPEVQALFVRWQNNLRNFYEPTLDMMRGLGQLYNSDPAFIENLQKLHEDLPAYLEAGITQYVDDREYAEIERMLAEDEADAARRLG